jgi:hypothetical protein
VTDLVERGEQVVQALELLAELRERAQHHRHHQLRREELPDGQLAGHHQPAAEAEQRRGRHRRQQEQPGHLAEPDPEVDVPRREVPAGQRVGALAGPVGRPAVAEQRRGRRDLLDPGGDLVFGVRLGDRGGRRAEPGHGEHAEQRQPQERRVEQEPR